MGRLVVMNLINAFLVPLLAAWTMGNAGSW